MKDDITLGLHLDDSKARAKGQKFAKDMSGLKIEPSLSLGKITTDFTKFEQSLDAATARVVAFTATTSLLYGVGSAFKRLTQDAIQIESVMARIQSIFGSTASETKQFQSAIFGLANDVGLSFFQVAEAAEEFSRQGLSLNKTLEATRAAAVVAKLSGAELKGVIEGLTATLSTFNDGTLDYIQVANKLVALDSAFATSAAGITEGLKRVSGVAVQAGLSFDETAAAITSLKQVTGRSEAVIGNSLKSIFTSLQTEKVQKDLATLGVETKDANGEFRNLVEVLSDLSKVYGTLGDAQKTVIAQRIGKTYQANAFQGILRTFETGDYEKALTTSKNAGSSAEDRLEKLNQTTQSALQRFSNNITQLGGNLGDKLGKPLLDTVVGYMNSAIEAGNKIFGGSGLGDALIGGLKNVLEGPGIVILTFSVAKLLTRIIKESGQAIKSITGLSGAKENILRIDQFITSNLSEQNKVELERIKTLTSVAAQQKAILDLMNRQLAAQEKMRSQGTLVKDYGITSLQSLGPAAASKAARKIPNRGKGELPEVNKAILREAVDIRNGVGGARATATPLVKTLNLGKGPETVVVNSDEKIVPNFAGSGQHAVLNREMMGYAGGSIPKRYFPKDEYGYSKINRGVHDESFLEFKLDKKNKVIEVGKVFSRQKGDAFKNFQALAGFAGRSGFTIKSGDFTNQYISMVGDGGEKGFFKAFPQIRYREGLSSSTYGSYQFRHPYESEKGEQQFSSIYELRDQVKNLSQEQISRIQFKDVFDEVLDLKHKTGKRNRGFLNSLPRPSLGGKIPSGIGGSSSINPSLKKDLQRKQSIRDAVGTAYPTGYGQFSQGKGQFVTGIPNTIYGAGASSSVFSSGSYIYKGPNPIGKTALREVVSPLGQNVIASGFSPAAGGNYGYKNIPGVGVSKFTSARTGVGSSSFGGVPATVISPKLTRPIPATAINPRPVQPITATLIGSGKGQGVQSGVDISDLRASPVSPDSGREALLKEFQEENAGRDRRAKRISDIVSRGGKLSSSGSKFFNENKELFSEDVSERLKKKKVFGKFSSEKVLGAGFAATFIGGAVAEKFKTKDGEDTQASRAIAGISESVGIGSSLALFGKLPGVIGLAAGGVLGLNEALGENLNSLNGVAKNHDTLVTKYRDEAAAIDSYRQNFESLSDAISSGSKKAAVEARKNLTAALGEISDPGFRSELSSASSTREVSRISNRISEQRGRELAGSEALSSVAKLRQENRQSFIEQTGIPIPFVGRVGGGRDYAPDGSYEAISNQLIKSIDFSKFSDTDKERIKSEGFNISDLDETNKKTLKIFSERFKGEEIILKAIEKRVLAEKESAKSVENLGKIIQRAQDFTNVISGSAQKASYSIFEKTIKSSLTSSLADISLQGAKPFTSEIAFAEAQFAVDKSRRSQDLASKSAGLNASLIEKAQELTQGRNLDFAQLGKIQDAFSKFGKTQDVGTFLKDFEGIIGTDSKEFVKFAQGQFLERKKLSAETAAGNQEADERQRNLIEELKRGQRAALFGGGVNKFDRSQAIPGLTEILKGPKYNKFNDPTRPGFGIDAKTGRATFSSGEFAREESNALDANAIGDTKIIQRAQYLQESGYFGVEPTVDTPAYIKDNRQKLIEQERKPLIGALTRRRQGFARDSILTESGERISKINEASKNITGQISITDEQKKIISDAIKSGSYDTAIGAFDESTKGLRKNYEDRGKVEEIAKIDAFKTSLLTQKENVSNIPLAAEEQAKSIIKDQTIEGKNITLLTDIKKEEIRANESLSTIASLMAKQEAAAVTEKRISEYNIAAGDLESLKIQREDNVKKYQEILRSNDIGGFVDREVLKSGDRTSIIENIKQSVSEPGTTKAYENRANYFLSELRNVKSDDEIKSKIKEKQSVVDSFQDVRNNAVKDLTEKLGATFGKISEKLEAFFGGDKAKTSKIDQNINLDINATVAGANILAGSDFKDEMASFISSYVTRKMGEIWKENTGNIMIEPPSNGFATA